MAYYDPPYHRMPKRKLTELGDSPPPCIATPVPDCGVKSRKGEGEGRKCLVAQRCVDESQEGVGSSHEDTNNHNNVDVDNVEQNIEDLNLTTSDHSNHVSHLTAILSSDTPKSKSPVSSSVKTDPKPILRVRLSRLTCRSASCSGSSALTLRTYPDSPLLRCNSCGVKTHPHSPSLPPTPTANASTATLYNSPQGDWASPPARDRDSPPAGRAGDRDSVESAVESLSDKEIENDNVFESSGEALDVSVTG